MQRIYNTEIPVIAITGGIATGKSFVTNIIREKHHVICADELVKKIYQEPCTHDFIRKTLPDCYQDGVILFTKLREKFFNDKKVKEQIESIIYQMLPLFFKAELPNSAKFIFYDIPLLFEKKLESAVDKNILVYAPLELQISRLVQRDNISEQLALKIINNQMPIDDKKSKADYIIYNDKNFTISNEKKEFIKKVHNLTSEAICSI
jgi:dephospho-CoA kinase